MTWREYRVKDAAGITNGHPFDATQFSERGELALVRIRDLVAPAFTTYVPRDSAPEGVLLNDGDIVIGMDGDFNAVLWRRGEAALNQRLCALRTNPSFDRRFLAYLLPAPLKAINDLTYSTTVKHLSSKQIADIRFLAPDAVQQGRIADYLDRETAQIDALIAKQERLIATLRERRVAVITRAVTTGTRAAEMQNSGADWFARLPTHWKAARLKWSVRSAQTGTWGSDPRGDGADVVCVRVADFDRPRLGVGRAETRRSVSASDLAPRLLSDGDLLLEKSGGTGLNPVGFVAYFADIGEPAVSSNFITRLRTFGHSRYWLYAHAASYATRLTARSVNQTTGIQNLDQSSYFNEVFPFPPESEQIEIAMHLDRQTAKIDKLIAKAERFIELSKERRAALITAAVTGQLEIPADGAPHSTRCTRSMTGKC